VVCALTLSLLGVPDEDIAADYALTSPNLRRHLALLLAENPGHDNLDEFPLDTPAEAMRLFLAELRAEHGSIERYLAGAGLPPHRIGDLRDHLLAPASDL